MLYKFRSALSRRDDGVALLMAVMTGTFAVALALVVTSTVIVGSQNSGRDRQRAVAVSAAEAGVDASYAQVQGAGASTLPCSVAVTSKGSDITTVNSTLRYYDTNGALVACAGGYIPAASAASVVKAEIVSTAVTTNATGSIKSTRTMEALANIKPVITATLGDALFSNSQMTFDNIGQVIGSNGNDANVYTNSIANCQNGTNNLIQGSVMAQGSVLLSGPCKIMGDLWTKGAITVNGENAVINGYARSQTQIDLNINSITIGKRAEAPVVKKLGATCTLSYCFQTTPAAPAAKPFPIIRGDAAAQQLWSASGYNVKVIDGSSLATLGVNCTTIGSQYSAVRDNSLNVVTDWIRINAPSWTGKTLVVSNCPGTNINLQNNGQIKLAGDLAIMSYGGFNSAANVMSYAPNDGQKHVLHLVVPYDAVAPTAVGTCHGYPDPEVRLQQNSIDSKLTTLVYGPCDVTVSNSVTLTGQIYAGSNLNLNNGLTIQFAEVPMPSGSVITTGGTISGFTLDVIYKRESRG